ncbi:MAG: hypothetical protein LBU25_11415 [Treponema sp.]|jgi:hypothetical protein|nr:hypothetical protein [Treponema sp.]
MKNVMMIKAGAYRSLGLLMRCAALPARLLVLAGCKTRQLAESSPRSI